jgi:hypothetical protein
MNQAGMGLADQTARALDLPEPGRAAGADPAAGD